MERGSEEESQGRQRKSYHSRTVHAFHAFSCLLMTSRPFSAKESTVPRPRPACWHGRSSPAHHSPPDDDRPGWQSWEAGGIYFAAKEQGINIALLEHFGLFGVRAGFRF